MGDGALPIKRLVRGAEVELRFDLDPPVSEWRLVSQGESGTSATYQADGYSLVIEEAREEAYTLGEFSLRRDSGQAFTLHRYVLEVLSSSADLHQVWTPWQLDMHVEFVGLARRPAYAAWAGDHRGAGQAHRTMADRCIPIIIGKNRKGTTTLAAAFLDQRIETEINHQVTTHVPSGSQPRGTSNFSLHRPTDGHSIGPISEHRDGFFLSSGLSWFDTLRLFRSVYDERSGRRFRPSPDPAWEPVWAPWGAPKDEWAFRRPESLGPDEIWDMAPVLRELGFRGLINWLSWFGDVEEKFKGREMTWGFPEYIGDFEASSKFPDLPGLIAKLKSLDQMSMLWISPWMAGRQTRVRQRLKEALIELDMSHEDEHYKVYSSYLCPRNPITQRYVPELMARVLRETGADGYTVDMIDSTSLEPCIADHEHSYSSIGLAVADTFSRIREACDEVNPNAVIEFRARYSNISNIYNATAHRSPDSGEGGSYDMNRRQCLVLRSYIPPGVAVHNDPVWWHIDENDQTVAKMLSTMVVSGVPQVGADVVNMTDEHRRLLKAWLSFYQTHKEDFRYGQMMPIQDDPMSSTILIERDRKAFVSYASFPALRVPLSADAEEIYLFNCTDEDSLYTILLNIDGEFRATVHNYDLSPLSESKVTGTEGTLLVDLPVPQGGCVSLSR